MNSIDTLTPLDARGPGAGAWPPVGRSGFGAAWNNILAIAGVVIEEGAANTIDPKRVSDVTTPSMNQCRTKACR